MMNEQRKETVGNDSNEYNPLSIGDIPPTKRHDLKATDSPLYLLFNSPIAVKVIAVFLLDATFNLTLNELTNKTRLQETTVENELQELTELNIVTKTDTDPIQYTLNTDHAVTTKLKELEWELEPLRDILIETRGETESNNGQ